MSKPLLPVIWRQEKIVFEVLNLPLRFSKTNYVGLRNWTVLCLHIIFIFHWCSDRSLSQSQNLLIMASVNKYTDVWTFAFVKNHLDKWVLCSASLFNTMLTIFKKFISYSSWGTSDLAGRIKTKRLWWTDGSFRLSRIIWHRNTTCHFATTRHSSAEWGSQQQNENKQHV